MNAASEAVELEALADVPIETLNGKVFHVRAGGFTYPLRLSLTPGAERFFVMLNGAVDRKVPLPVFARWNWGKVLKGHVLAVCDPTLYLDEQLRLGWFLGRSSEHAIPGLVALAERVRKSLDIPADRRVFYGSSGGGFAAIVAACHAVQGRAIAFNPQTDVFRYYPRNIAPLLKLFGGEVAARECGRAHPERWEAMAAMEMARRHANPVRVVIAQNRVDNFHFVNHFTPFVKAEGAALEGGVNPAGNVLSMVYESPEGHGAEPPEVVRRLVDEGVPFLCRSDKDKESSP